MCDSGYRDVDIVITTRELGRMIREAGIDFKNLPEENFDSPLGTGSGAGVIFGTTGGVMEAALRTVADVLAGETCRTWIMKKCAAWNIPARLSLKLPAKK